MASASDLDNFCFIYSIVLFCVTFTLELFVVVKVRMRMDLPMILIILAYLFSFGLGAFMNGNLAYLSASTTFLIQLIMYFFVFEMMKVKDKLSSESFAESLAKYKRTRMQKWAIFGSFILLVIAPMMVYLGFDLTNIEP